ncbi:MAG: hypothetical protein V1800_03655 [Candidatus Latescibacterota bacterium]
MKKIIPAHGDFAIGVYGVCRLAFALESSTFGIRASNDRTARAQKRLAKFVK